MQKLIVALCLGAGAAYVAPAAPKAAPALAATKDEVVALAEANPDFLGKAIGFWDPLGALDTNFWGLGNEGTIGYLRHAEIKHGRVAMAAFLGCVVTGLGVEFPGPINVAGKTFAEVGSGGLLDFWDNTPAPGRLQIISTIGAIEYVFESQQPHYLRGGKPGFIRLTPGVAPWHASGYDPMSKYDAETRKKKRDMELANGTKAARTSTAGSGIPKVSFPGRISTNSAQI